MRHLHQRGAATLAITLVLLLAFALAALLAQRRQVDEQRSATRRQHAGQAFEAAEAGLEWGLAMLNEPRSVDAQCHATSGTATSFRQRTLAIDPASGRIDTRPTAAGCSRTGDAWECRCAADAPTTTDGPGTTAAFALTLQPAATAGLVRLTAVGCRRAPCGETTDDASRRLDVTLGLVPALAHPPVAALTVRGDVDAGGAALTLHSRDTGIAVHAGGVIRAPSARYGGAAGAPTATRVEGDASLRSLDPERLFASLFGLDKALWRRQPGVASVTCTTPCNDRLRDALAAHRLVVVDGDLPLDGGIAIGTPERPAIVVVSGDVRLRGAVVMHGLLYGTSLTWNDAPAGGLVRGAVVVEGGYAGNAAPVLIHDGDVLAALKTAGSFARLPGSWKDFP
jgi:Tfp pilus assembly protein PilX